ncbi:TolC family protein [Halosquirtibacter xylanolyticus]|uniref:TolC family protein n=1 Tax=Halosquirtibacter xylanolyticus TaxID=3374599 RepID=UPI00374A5638|nr:TolC family protein [Prolixibacteraceae bacterium]
MKNYYTRFIRILWVCLFVNLYNHSLAQTTITLMESMKMAQKQSLDAFKAENMYLVSYWDYRMYHAQKLPWITSDFTPANYRRSFVKRYNQALNIDQYKQEQSLENNLNFEINQNLVATGGRFFITSGTSRLQNFGNTKSTSFNTNIIQVGFSQPLNGYNEFKWRRKVAPLQYEIAKADYILQLENIHLNVVAYYFNFLISQERYRLQKSILEDAKSSIIIGKERFKTAFITKSELVDLELDVYNAEVQLAEANKSLMKSKSIFTSYLDIDANTDWTPVLPAIDNKTSIDKVTAIQKAFENNPEILGLKTKELTAAQQVDKRIKESRFKANIGATYGLNQQGPTFNESLKDPMDQQSILLNLSIPILDWGNRKGQKQKALKNQEVVRIEAAQKRQSFEQEVLLATIDFNLQPKVVNNSQKAKNAAEDAYNMNYRRYIEGNVDLLQLQSSRQKRSSAQIAYIQSIYQFWSYLYKIRKQTLYDFQNSMPLSTNFDALVTN